ncbi:MAG: hypothetical protein KJO35_00610, partial [Gammaproteobacteria bacterium]|nr:hypothetical protein [Gammaproteobacteria bacterium]
MLRDAIRAAPDDPELRLWLAEIYIDLEQGALAISALDQALERGLSSSRAALPRARALFKDGQFLEVLELPVSDDLGITDLLKLKLLRAEALNKRSDSSGWPDDGVTQAYIDVLELIEQHKDVAEVDDIRNGINDGRQNDEVIERAWQHFACRFHQPRTFEWQASETVADQVIRVGPHRSITSIAEAARVASDGDTVEIDAADYEGGVALWPQNRIIVKGVGGRPSITSNGKVIQRRDVWLFTGNDVTVENVEISGARSEFENGAGIRHTGAGLTLRHVFLHNNENGLLTGNGHPDTNKVLIEFSEFASNGDARGYAHNIYVGRAERFEMRFSYTHEARGGHLVKSRARRNLLSYNRLSDEQGGTSSYVIDLPEGGVSEIVGNLIEQGSETLNHGIISFAGEEVKH